MTDLEVENKQLKARIQQQQATYTMLSVETSTYRGQVKEQEKNTEVLRSKVRSMKEELTALEVAHESTVQREKELQKIVEERNIQLEELRKENISLLDTLEKQKKKLKALSMGQERLKRDQENVEDLKLKLEALQKSDNPKTQTIQSLKNSIQMKDEYIMNLDRDMAMVSNSQDSIGDIDISTLISSLMFM
jgi:chromosome segregation ATPase